MKIIPAVSILKGKVAVAEGGQYVPFTDPQGEPVRPERLVRDFPREEVFILDIDGIERFSPNFKTIKKMAAYKDVWLDAGVRDADDVVDMFVGDAAKVVVGTKSLFSLGELEEAVMMSKNIILSIDYNGKIMSPRREIAEMDVLELARAASEIDGLDTLLFMDLGGHLHGTYLDIDTVRELVGLFPGFYVSGNMPERPGLEDWGITGRIVDFRAVAEDET